MIEAAPLNYLLIWGITIAIMIGVVIVISTLVKIIWKIPYKNSLSHNVGCLWAIILFIGGAFVYGRVRSHYTPKTVEIVVVNGNGSYTHKKYVDYFESPNGQKVTYDDQKESKGYYLYNNTSSVIEKVHHFYGKHSSSLPNEMVVKEIYPGDLVNLIIEPDYMFTPAPSVVTITTRHNHKITSTSKSQLRFSEREENSCAPSPPVAAEIFSNIERCDFITRSHRSVYITTWLISLFRVEPLVTAASALVESVCHTGEQFSICVTVIVLIVFLTSCAVAGVKHLVFFSAGSSGCAYSVGGEFCCHSSAV